MQYPSFFRMFALGSAGLLLSACASTPTAINEASSAALLQQLSLTHPRIESSSLPGTEATTLMPDDAARLMLLHSPRIRALLAQTGIEDARRAQASLISNPRFAVGALRPEGGGRWQLDFGLTQSLLDVFTRSIRKELAEQQWLQAQLQLQSGLQDAVAVLQERWFSAVAAREVLAVQQTQLRASEARALFARSLYEAGNLTETTLLLHELDLTRQKNAFEDAQLADRREQASLRYLIGVDEKTFASLQLPSALPAVPTERFDKKTLLAIGHQHQPAFALLNARQEHIAQQAGLTRRSLWRDVGVGVEWEREFDGSKNTGAQLEIGLPVFDRGNHRLAALAAESDVIEASLDDYRQKMNRDISTALDQLSAARATQQRLVEAVGLANKRLLLMQREVNFMISSPFELLVSKQQVLQFEEDAIRSRENYWKARASLERSIGQQLPLPESALIPETPGAPIQEHNHHDHHSMHGHAPVPQQHDHNHHASPVEHGGHHHD